MKTHETTHWLQDEGTVSSKMHNHMPVHDLILVTEALSNQMNSA